MVVALTIIAFVLLLGAMILIHELGHFMAARIVGITVEEFSIGMGPVLWSKVKNEVKYSIRALPIGGFVKMLGEDDMDLNVKGSFGSKNAWQKLFVIIAGVFMNFVLVVLIGYGVGFILNFQYRYPLLFADNVLIGQEVRKPIVGLVSEDSPASEAGLEQLDIVLSADGNEIDGNTQLIDYIKENAGEEVELTVVPLYGKNERKVSVLPRVDPPEGEGALGVTLLPGGIGIVTYDGVGKYFSGFSEAINLCALNVESLVEVVKMSFREKTAEPLSAATAGPIGLFSYIHEAVKRKEVMGVLAIASNAGVMLVLINLLPIPALDGGFIPFLLVEGLTGKKLPGKVLEWMTRIGMVLLLLLVLLVFVNDLMNHTKLKEGLCNAFHMFCE